MQCSESRFLWNAVGCFFTLDFYYFLFYAFLLKNGNFSEFSPFVLYAGIFSYLAVYMELNKH